MGKNEATHRQAGGSHEARNGRTERRRWYRGGFPFGRLPPTAAKLAAAPVMA